MHSASFKGGNGPRRRPSFWQKGPTKEYNTKYCIVDNEEKLFSSSRIVLEIDMKLRVAE